MSLLTYIIVFSLIGGVASLIGGILLLSYKKGIKKFAYLATPFAAGALLAAVFLDLLPEGLHEASASQVLFATLAGILVFFLAERFLRWFHHHHQHGTDPGVPLIVTGDTLHNFIDGVIIAAAFLVSIPTGIVATIAVAAHEIPQEIGDFGLLLKKGVRRRNVLIINILSSLATVVAAVLTYAIGSAEQLPLGVILGLSAGFLLYIAMSDIIPSLHEERDSHRLLNPQPFMLLAGLIVVAVAIQIAHGYIDAGHDHSHGEPHHAHIEDHHDGEDHHENEHHEDDHEEDHHDEHHHDDAL